MIASDVAVSPNVSSARLKRRGPFTVVLSILSGVTFLSLATAQEPRATNRFSSDDVKVVPRTDLINDLKTQPAAKPQVADFVVGSGIARPWVYKVVNGDTRTEAQTLREAGDENWELVQVIPEGGHSANAKFCFKKLK